MNTSSSVAQARADTEFVEQRRLWLLLASVNNDALAATHAAVDAGRRHPATNPAPVISSMASQSPAHGWDFLVAHRAQIEALLDPLIRSNSRPASPR